jgi:hypothetical protein
MSQGARVWNRNRERMARRWRRGSSIGAFKAAVCTFSVLRKTNYETPKKWNYGGNRHVDRRES